MHIIAGIAIIIAILFISEWIAERVKNVLS